MDLAHFDAAAFARPARRPMVVVRLPNTGYRGRKSVVKILGPTADGQVARRGAPPNVRATIVFPTTNTETLAWPYTFCLSRAWYSHTLIISTPVRGVARALACTNYALLKQALCGCGARTLSVQPLALR